jgi:hypothetical protein
MTIPKGALERITEVASLDIHRDVCKGRRHGVEENIKTGIVIPILEAIGWLNPQDMDFEHRKKDGAADILLKHEGTSPIVVECKSVEIRISSDRVQALGYAQKRGAKYAVLTNGISWEILPTWVEGVPIERITPYYVLTLSGIRKNPEAIYALLSQESLSKLDELVKEKRESLRRRIDEEAFLLSLTKFRFSLYQLIRKHFDAHYPKDPAFKACVDDWLTKNPSAQGWSWIREAEDDNDFWNLIRGRLRDEGIPDDWALLRRRSGKQGLSDQRICQALREGGIPLDWIDRLCFEGAYAFVNRVLFLRMYEDRIAGGTAISRPLSQLLPESGSKAGVQAAIRLLFERVANLFPSLYSVPLYDNVLAESIDWEASVLRAILDHTQKHNFSELDRDLLGDVYQHHTPRPIRRALGQFYTDPTLARYMFDRAAELVGISEEEVVVDPACGSGTFLLAAYDRLKQGLMAKGMKPAGAHEFLLRNSLVGIDVDAFAVQLATMNLLLRDTSVGPSVNGVVQGNSLTQSMDGFGEEASEKGTEIRSLHHILERARRQSPNGLRIVLGNPPHHPVRKDNPTYESAFASYFSSLQDGLTNISSMFLVRWASFLSPGGVLAFILPKVFVWNESYGKVRDWISDKFQLIEIIDLGKAWDEVGLEQIILVVRRPLSKQKPNQESEVKVLSGVDSPDMLAEGQVLSHSVKQRDLARKGMMWRLYAADPEFPRMPYIWRKVESDSVPLSDVADIFRGYPKADVEEVGGLRRGAPSQRRFLAGRNIGFDRNFTCWSLSLDEVLWADPQMVAGGGEIGERKLAMMKRPKVVCKRLVSSDVKVDAWLDESGNFLSIDTVTNIVPKQDCGFRLDYLYGVLNSILGTVYLRDMVFNRSILTMDMDTPYLGKIPIHRASESDQKDIGLTAARIQKTAAELSTKDRTRAAARVAGLLDELDRKVLRAYGVEDHYDTFRALRKPSAYDPSQTQLTDFG